MRIKFNFIPSWYGATLPTEIEISESEPVLDLVLFVLEVLLILWIKVISNNLHEKLCSELKELNYKGIRYSGFVEPLIDKNIFNLISMARTYLPNVNMEMVTNGDPLNLKRLIKLFDCGLNRILISAYDGKDEAEKLEFV